VIACGMGAGTASEVALAIKANKLVVLLTDHLEGQRFFTSLSTTTILLAETPIAAIEIVKNFLKSQL
jgi:hypothetical protein